MPENITTVLNLPDADFGSGGFSNPADNRVYILQGEGSDRDRKVSLGDLFDKEAAASSHPLGCG